METRYAIKYADEDLILDYVWASSPKEALQIFKNAINLDTMDIIECPEH